MLVCVDTRPLLETVLEIHYVVTEVSGPVSTVSIRSGVSSGDVILMEGDDYVGHCVNVASRLCDLAPASEAWATPSVMEHLPSWGIVASETPVSLRGVEKPVPAASLRMALAGEDGSRDPICGLPLSHDTAEEIAHDVRGSVVLFCSSGCVDTWRRRPAGDRSAARAAG
jgi:class 3 adenylate cyclase